jgi:hypothetical protein
MNYTPAHIAGCASTTVYFCSCDISPALVMVLLAAHIDAGLRCISCWAVHGEGFFSAKCAVVKYVLLMAVAGVA